MGKETHLLFSHRNLCLFIPFGEDVENYNDDMTYHSPKIVSDDDGEEAERMGSTEPDESNSRVESSSRLWDVSALPQSFPDPPLSQRGGTFEENFLQETVPPKRVRRPSAIQLRAFDTDSFARKGGLLRKSEIVYFIYKIKQLDPSFECIIVCYFDAMKGLDLCFFFFLK